MNNPVAILGSQGQLGREFLSIVPGAHGLTRADADLAVPGQISSLIQKLKPVLVINCSAYNLVDQCEATPEPALAVNALGVRELAIACRDVNATLLHFSTDYVFGLDAARTQPYVEGDAPGPISAYGLSKLAGEYFVRSLCPKHYVIRSCGLYGKHGVGGKGTNFVEAMIKLAKAGKTIRVVNDQVLTPTSVSELAKAAYQMIQSCPHRLYHLTNAGQCSWFEFASAIFEMAGIQSDLQPTSSAAYGSKAARPAYSVLQSEKPGVPKLRHWRDALQEYLASRNS